MGNGECGMGNAECGVRNGELGKGGTLNVEQGMSNFQGGRSAECGMGEWGNGNREWTRIDANGDLGRRKAEWGMGNAEWGAWGGRNTQCRTRNVQFPRGGMGNGEGRNGELGEGGTLNVEPGVALRAVPGQARNVQFPGSSAKSVGGTMIIRNGMGCRTQELCEIPA